MSRFFSDKYRELKAYVPGEQPRDQAYIKLNTNENPFPPHPEVLRAAAEEAGKLQLYSDPECREITSVLAENMGVKPENLLMTNGSDEILNFAFMAFCDEKHPAVFPDITYGFYPVFAQVNCLPYLEIPLEKDLSMPVGELRKTDGVLFIANPNAPTGLAVSRETIREMLEEKPERLIVVDEAYVDFGGESCVELIRDHENLLVTQTFSKFRSMAGMRLGYGIACEALIRDLKTIQYSTNPYNVDRVAQAAGAACLRNDGYNRENARTIIANREAARKALAGMGFHCTDSRTNFLFARHERLDGGLLYRRLKERGILIRHFDTERIRDYNRITVGTREQMDRLIRETERILQEEL